MRKMIAFLLLIACCVGVFCWGHGAVSAQGDDVIITEHVLQGDPAWAAGRNITTQLNWSQHLYWTTNYALDGEYDTRFHFLQQRPAAEEYYGGHCEIWTHTGFGASGGIDPTGDTGYAPMFRELAEKAVPGEESTFNVRMADYLEYYPLEVDIYYSGEDTYCGVASTDLFDYINGKPNAGKLNEVERFFHENFPIPVGEDDMAEVSIYKNENGYINSVGLNVLTDNWLSFSGLATEIGIYFWVEAFPIGGDTEISDIGPEGPGVYFIPWKETGQRNLDGQAEITPDVERVERIYALEPGARIFITDCARDEKQLRFLTWEDGWYVFTALDAATGEEIVKFPLVQHQNIADGDYPDWAWDEEVICTQIGDQVILLWDHDGVITHEFTVPAGESDSFVGSWEPGYDSMYYDGEKLILVSVRTWYEKPGYLVCGYDREGLQLLADYDVSVMQIIERIGYNNFDYARPVIE